jgi:GT2 family glycosyltransferase
LLSLRKQALNDFTTVVVDDGSTDGTATMLHEQFPEVVVIPGDGNLWWSRATNAGVRYALEAGADHVMTLNNDTIAPDDFIAKMRAAAEQRPTALIGALAVDADTGNFVYGGQIVRWTSGNFVDLLMLLKKDEVSGLHAVTHLPGRGLLIPSLVFNKVGLFDADRFPQVMADYDFSGKATKAGYETFCNCDARLLIYPQESGDVQLRRAKSIRHYYLHLFGIKGGGNLGFFCKFALLNCPRKFLILFLVLGMSRRIAGYLLDWVREILLGKEPFNRSTFPERRPPAL